MPTIEVLPDAEQLLQQIADALLKSRKVVVITGAGISTNSGIPDFRSENGLYSLIQAQFDAANKLHALTAAEADDTPAVDERSEPPPPKRRRLSQDNEPTLPSVVVATSPPRDAASTITEPQYPQYEAPSARDSVSGPEGRPLEDFQAIGDWPTQSIATTANPVNPLESHVLAQPIPDSRLSRPTVASSPLRQALHASTYATCPGQELAAVPEHASDTIHDLPHDETESGPIPCSACTERVSGESRRSRAASMPPGSLRPANIEMYQASLRRARSASPSRRDCHCRASSTRQPFQRPENSQYSTPRRRGVHGVTSPPLSLPHMSGAGLSSARSKASARTPSRFRRGHRGINSSPLSSPPPVLFDPYQESSSSTSHQGSSEAGSAASSESGETPPSSMPSLTSQTSNPSRSSLPNLKGRDLFDVSIWSDPIRTSVFYTFASTLRQKSRDVEPTASHHFISHLRDRGKLVRCYTQNIDQIEEKVGLSTSLQQGPGSRGRFSRKSAGGFSNTSEPTDGKDNARRVDVNNGGVECVFLHGSLQSLRCFLCGQVCEWDEEGRHLETLSGRQPECPHCAGATAARQERGKRALGVGKLRPDIVLYGEEHPNAHLIDPLVKHDLGLYPDFMLILGTSLKVHGLKVIVREFAKAVHSKGGKVVFVNFTKAPESAWGDIIDYWIRWDCDAWVANLQQRIPLLWLPPGTKLPAPPKRKRESSNLEKASKKRSSGLVKQGSSIVVHSPADTTVTEDTIAVLGPLKPSSISDTGSQNATVADCTGNAASAGDVQGVVMSSAEPQSSEVPPAAIQPGALSADALTTAFPELSRPGDASSGYSAATFELRPSTNEPTAEAPAADGTSILAASTPKTPKAPARPMSLREDKCSGAYLAWQITRDLRRLSGSAAEVATFSSPIARVKPVRTPRSAGKTTPPSSTPAGAPGQTHLSPSDDSPSIRPPRAAQPEAILEAIQAEPTLEEAPLQDPIPARATQQDSYTQQAIQEDLIPEEALQEDSIMSETTLENTVPVAAAEEETIPEPALQTTSMSEQVIQADSIPEEAVQEIPSVQAPVPELSMPEETASAPLPPPASPPSPPASPSSALSSPPPTPPSAEATLDPVAPSAPIAKAAAAAKSHRKSLPAYQQSSGPRPLRSQRKSLPMPSMSTPLSATPTASSKSKNKGKPKQAKGWVYVRDDDPEVQAIQRRQAMHWGTDENPLPALPPPANAHTDDGKKKEKPKKGKGWVYVLEDDPEAQAIEQRQAMYWGAEPPTQTPPPAPADAKPDGSKKKEKSQKGKGWVYVRDDDPEAQAIQQRQAKYWGTETSTRQPPPPPIDEGKPGNGKKTAKARKSKGWVYVSEDDPEAQALEMRQAMHWAGAERPRRVDETAHPEQSPAPNPQSLPSNDADLDTSQPAIASSAKGKPRGKREKGKGWSYLPEDAPEAQEIQLRQAKNFGIGLDNNTASAQSIYDALKSNPRHRKRKTIDGVEVALVADGRASRRSLPAPRAAASMQHDAHATSVFQPLPDPNEMLPMPVASVPMQKRTWSDKENQSTLPSQVSSGSSLAPMHHPRPLPLTRPQPLEPLSPPPGHPAAIAPSMGRPEQGHMLAPTAFAISDALLYHFRAPPRIWTPEDQLREEAAVLALSSLKTGLR